MLIARIVTDIDVRLLFKILKVSLQCLRARNTFEIINFLRMEKTQNSGLKQ